jgi:hypothetical protein
MVFNFGGFMAVFNGSFTQAELFKSGFFPFGSGSQTGIHHEPAQAGRRVRNRRSGQACTQTDGQTKQKGKEATVAWLASKP